MLGNLASPRVKISVCRLADVNDSSFSLTEVIPPNLAEYPKILGIRPDIKDHIALTFSYLLQLPDVGIPWAFKRAQ